MSRLAGPGVCASVNLCGLTQTPDENTFQPVSAAILCAGGGLDVIRKETWPFYRTSSGVRLCWELEGSKGPKGQPTSPT